MSARVKFVEASLSVKVIVAVSPALRDVLLLAIAIVGEMVSIWIVGEREPTALPLPSASVNALAATEIDPAVVEFAVGVNVAV